MMRLADHMKLADAGIDGKRIGQHVNMGRRHENGYPGFSGNRLAEGWEPCQKKVDVVRQSTAPFYRTFSPQPFESWVPVISRVIHEDVMRHTRNLISHCDHGRAIMNVLCKICLINDVEVCLGSVVHLLEASCDRFQLLSHLFAGLGDMLLSRDAKDCVRNCTDAHCALGEGAKSSEELYGTVDCGSVDVAENPRCLFGDAVDSCDHHDDGCDGMDDSCEES